MKFEITETTIATLTTKLLWKFLKVTSLSSGFSGNSVVKSLPTKAGDIGSIPESGRSPGGGEKNPLQTSCLENPMDRGAWWATP